MSGQVGNGMGLLRLCQRAVWNVHVIVHGAEGGQALSKTNLL